MKTITPLPTSSLSSPLFVIPQGFIGSSRQETREFAGRLLAVVISSMSADSFSDIIIELSASLDSVVGEILAFCVVLCCVVLCCVVLCGTWIEYIEHIVAAYKWCQESSALLYCMVFFKLLSWFLQTSPRLFTASSGSFMYALVVPLFSMSCNCGQCRHNTSVKDQRHKPQK